MMTRFFSLFILLFLIVFRSFSQDSDFGMWYNANVEIELAKKLDLDLSANLRTFQNTSKIDEVFGEAGFTFKIIKGLSASATYRLTSQYEDKEDGYYLRHRLMGDMKGTVEVGRFDFSGRIRIQRETKTYYRDDNDLIPNNFLRLKFKSTYRTNNFPVNPYVSYEAFARIFEESTQAFEKFRYSVGAEYKINKNHSFELEYLYQKDYYPKVRRLNVISVGYNLKF